MVNVPTLPHDDPYRDHRPAALAAARQTYAISYDIVPGLPMVATLPHDEKPSLQWLAHASEVLLNVFGNLESNRISVAEKDAGIDVDGDDRPANEPPPKGNLHAAWSAITAALTTDLRAVNHHITDVLGGIERLLSGQHLRDMGHFRKAEPNPDPDAKDDLWASPLTPHGRPKSVHDFSRLFRDLPRPPVMDGWNEDSWFARMRVAGQNPMLLKGITALPANFPVTEAHYSRSAVPGDTLAAALAEGRLFMLDYKLLVGIVEPKSPAEGGFKYTPFPLALFAVRPGLGTLHPIAVQAGQDPAKFAIITPDQGWTWRKAKTAVQVADANYHEMVVHLGRTHLVSGAVALAAHHHFAPAHPLSVLLMPHFEGTLAINDSAAHSMLAKGGAIDLSFGGKLESMIKLAGVGVQAFDFFGNMPPADFAARGVAKGGKLIDYPYRDDALRLWEAINAWTRDYVDVYYADDKAILADPELQGWSAALTKPVGEGGVSGFKPIADRATLAVSLAMIIFTASCQHAAVNFPQWTQMSYSPGLAGALWTEWKDGEATEQDWLDLLPPLQYGELQAEFLRLLGGINHTRLGHYHSSHFPYSEQLVDDRIKDGPLPAFRAALERIEAEITAENKALKSRTLAYNYLLPSRIPASINV